MGRVLAALAPALRSCRCNTDFSPSTELTLLTHQQIPFTHPVEGLKIVKAQGKARFIGIANFQRHHIEPVMNQLELSPHLHHANYFVPWMREHSIGVLSFESLISITTDLGQKKSSG